jgi:cobalt-zinc-cadmium efflux system outer membrane protein
MRLSLCIICLALAQSAMAADSPPAAPDLHSALERAWHANPQAQALEARRNEVMARRGAAAALLPAAPAASASYRSDQLSRNAGQREFEAELGLPLWLPHEQAARLGLADAEQAELDAASGALRLAIAGELRDAVWAAALAENELQLGRERLQAAMALEKDVARRVDAGYLATTDLLVAQGETLAARGALLDREAQLAQARRSYALLSGGADLPEAGPEAPREVPSLENHPTLRAARTAIALATARVRLATKSRRESPELALFTRSERATSADPYSNSIGVKVRLPLSGTAYSQPAVAAAQTELTQAESEYRLLQQRVAASMSRAQQDLDNALQHVELAQQQQTYAAENIKLLQKAFDLGELDLPALMRARAASQQADLALAQRKIALARARAHLNQAQGILP